MLILFTSQSSLHLVHKHQTRFINKSENINFPSETIRIADIDLPAPCPHQLRPLATDDGWPAMKTNWKSIISNPNRGSPSAITVTTTSCCSTYPVFNATVSVRMQISSIHLISRQAGTCPCLRLLSDNGQTAENEGHWGAGHKAPLALTESRATES